jgi:hypothetical protein
MIRQKPAITGMLSIFLASSSYSGEYRCDGLELSQERGGEYLPTLIIYDSNASDHPRAEAMKTWRELGKIAISSTVDCVPILE